MRLQWVFACLLLLIVSAYTTSAPSRIKMERKNANVRISQSKEDLQRDLAAYVKNIAEESISERQRFVVAISGGSLPANLKGLLGDESIAWDKWFVLFVDERFVPLDHEQSNFRGAHEALFKHVGIPRDHIVSINANVSLEECASQYETRIKDIIPADLILLGMGEDGHTASLFPNHALLKERERLIAPIADSPKAPPQRITFTLPLIEQGRHVAFVATGEGKQGALNAIFNQGKSLPSKLVLDRNRDTVFFVDSAAAAKL